MFMCEWEQNTKNIPDGLYKWEKLFMFPQQQETYWVSSTHLGWSVKEYLGLLLSSKKSRLAVEMDQTHFRAPSYQNQNAVSR